MPTERRLSELSEAGEGMRQAGEPRGCRFGAGGGGDLPFTETRTPPLEVGGQKFHLRNARCGLPDRAESEHIVWCLSAWSTHPPTEALVWGALSSVSTTIKCTDGNTGTRIEWPSREAKITDSGARFPGSDPSSTPKQPCGLGELTWPSPTSNSSSVKREEWSSSHSRFRRGKQVNTCTNAWNGAWPMINGKG